MSGRTTLEVENVGYEVNGRRILSDVTTRFEAGEVTAVMGPSGAGKSTLLAVLGGRAPGTMVSGTILANNVPIDQERMRTLLSHMPQEDIMHEELTIRKTLYYAAMLRSSGELTSQEKLERADHIMDLLGIRGVADSTVMAVSGGQRKRASAAIEFLSSRPILTFDEPTSGLDSALASALVQRLVVAARDDGRTVVCTIHQPAWKLVEKFHRLFVLAPVADRGGMVVFDAPPSALPGFLCSGTDSPASANVDNPADYLLYALQRDGPEAWRDNWNASRPSSSLKTDPSQGVMPKAAPPQTSPSPTQLLLKCDERICSASAVLDALFEYSHKKASNYPISPFEQYVILTFRTFDVFFSDSSQCRLMLKMLAVYVVVGVALVYGMPQNFSKLNALLNIFLAQYTLTMLPLVVIMPSERRVIMREVRNGAFGVAPYWCARCTLGITYAFFVATVMTCIYPLLQLSLNPIAAKLFHWFVTQWVYMSCVMLFALTVGMLTSSPIAGIKAVVAFMIPWFVSSGMSPPLHLVRPFVFWLHYPNIFTWAFKILVVIGFSNNGDKAYEVLTGDDYLAVNTGNVKSCFFVLLLIFVVLFFIGLAVTHSVLKDKDGSAGSAATTPPPPAKLDPEIVVDDAEVGHEPSALLSPLLEDEGYSSRSSEDASEQVSEFEDVQPPPPCDPTDVELQKISYRYEAQPDEAKLEDISVLFKGSTVTALMGPSGAGKSTLLTLLTGRLPDGYVEGPSGAEHKLLQGRILVNGCDMESTQGFRNLGTLTPQDEHIPEVLTVREVLSYTAELRGVGGLGANNSAVESVLRELNLETVGDNVVGSAAKVGISGGQKKRVSVGIDLLANRPIMLVDEPTTGLDAASAANVLQALFRVSRHQNRTVVASIHQPAWELMQGFDQLVLLAKGRLMFTDAPSTLSDYFASGGAPVPEKVNPVDHVMFVLQADKSAVAKWHRFYEKKHMDTSDDPMVSKTNFSSSSLLDTGDHYSVSELKQFVILFRRMTRIFFVDDDQFMEFLVPGSINNLLTGLAFYNFPINFYTGTLVTTGLAGLSMFLLNGCVLTIPAERHVAVREFHNGTYSIRAFWFARCAVTIGMTTLFAPLFTAIWYSLAGFTGDFTVILHVVVSSLLSACSYTVAANIIGLIAGTQLRAAQICDPISLSAMLFSGTVIIRRFLKPFILPFYLISPINYAVENAMTILLEDKGDDGAEVLNYFEFHPDNRPRNYYILTFLLCATVIGGLFVANSTLAHL